MKTGHKQNLCGIVFKTVKPMRGGREHSCSLSHSFTQVCAHTQSLWKGIEELLPKLTRGERATFHYTRYVEFFGFLLRSLHFF